MGLAGSGKTSVAKLLQQKLNGIVINTDDLHSLLFPDGERTETGNFTPQQLEEIYRSLRPIVYFVSKANPDKHIILEGSFRYASQRDFITSILEQEGITYKIINFVLDDDSIAEKRITNRFENEEAPDTYEDYLKMKAVFEPEEDAYVIDNSGSQDELVDLVSKYIKTQI